MDTGIGQIQGVPYRVRLKPDQLYPIMDDPAGLSSKQEQQNWMEENVPEFAEKAQEVEGGIRVCSLPPLMFNGY